MNTAHEIVQEFMATHDVSWCEFSGWFNDGGYPQDEANIHDSRCLDHLQSFVEERNERDLAIQDKIAKIVERTERAIRVDNISAAVCFIIIQAYAIWRILG
jgi:hypothetical protein